MAPTLPHDPTAVEDTTVCEVSRAVRVGLQLRAGSTAQKNSPMIVSATMRFMIFSFHF
jgi:hypothetical protein